MKSKSAVSVVVVLFLAFFTWSVNTTLGSAVLGREAFSDWRADNTALFYGIWLAELVVLGIPALWVVGKRIGAYAAQQDQAALEARGVGRLAIGALRGNETSIAHLIKLLDDSSSAVRFQAARALALLDDDETDKELFRKVRYWDVDLKLGVIDVLKRTMDLRTIKLLRILASDRNPMVARKARTGLTIVSSRSGNIDGFIAKRRKQAQARDRKAARKKAPAAGEPKSAGQEPPAARTTPPAVEEAQPAAEKAADPSAAGAKDTAGD